MTRVLAAVLCAALCGCASQRIVERHYYPPTPETSLRREDGLVVGAVRVEVMKSGSPDWSDQKDISLVRIGR